MTARRDKAYRRFVSVLPCVACGKPGPSECAHVRMGHFGGVAVPERERGGTGMKPADKWCVSLCRHCHHDQHQFGERTFWTVQEINPLALAQALWRNRDNKNAARAIVMRARDGVTI